MAQKIYFFDEYGDYPISNEAVISGWLAACAKEEGYTIENINIVLMDDGGLLELNKEHLKHDFYTDIITFQYSDTKAIKSDIYLSVDRVRENAETYNQSEEDELHRLLIHGLLHTMKYNDKSEEDKAIMTEKEDYYLDLRPF